MNPFDLKAWFLAPNAQHPAIVHFPIALFIVSYGFDILAAWRDNSALRTAARYNLLAAALSAPFAAATGLIAWQWKHEGVALKGNLRLHLIGAITSAVLIWTLCWLRHRQNVSEDGLAKSPNKWYFFLGAFTAVLVVITAHIGGLVAG